jgi:hypothetical protein
VHVRDLVSSFPGVEYGQPLAYKIFLLATGGRGTAFYSATYLSDVYVDFALPGVLLIFFTIGSALAATQRWFFNLPPQPWAIACGIVIAFYVMNILRGGPTSFITSMVVLGIILTLHFTIKSLLRVLALIRPSETEDPVPEASARSI